MPKFRIFKTRTYEKDYDSLDNAEKKKIDKIINSLFETGDVTGRPLGFPFFREKKLENKRLIYLIYPKIASILIVAITDKNMQQATINEILLHLDEYQEYVLQKLKDAIGDRV